MARSSDWVSTIGLFGLREGDAAGARQAVHFGEPQTGQILVSAPIG
jgi:hypothetical protein